MKNTLGALGNILLGEEISKVEGRRNYVIYISSASKIAIFMGYGTACNNGYMSATLKDISAFGITWAIFTYKKDALKVLSALAEQGLHTSTL